MLLLANLLRAQEPLPPIGQWREHLPYNSAVDLAATDGLIWCATPYSLFSADPADLSVDRYSRVTGLSETGVSAIHANAVTGKLLVAYANSNIDILSGAQVHNVPGIRRSTIIGDKAIYNISSWGHDFYLSTGLGLVVVNGDRYEIKDSWFIGNGGNYVRVNGFASDGNFFYAATEEGLKSATVNHPRLSDYASWQMQSGANGLPAGSCRNVVNVQNKVVVLRNDSLWVLQNGNWSFLYADGWPVVSVTATENKLALCERNSNGNGRVVFLNPDGTAYRQLSNTAAVSFPSKALLLNNTPWVADQYACLSRFGTGTAYDQLVPNSPQGIASGDILFRDQTFFAAAGSVNDSWNYQYNGDGLYFFSGGKWDNVNRYRFGAIDSLLDYVALAFDERDRTLWAGSFGGGLLHVKAGPSFEIFKQGKLDETAGDPGSYRVAGLAFDSENNLWIANYGAAQTLKVRKADGSWKGFTPPYTLTDNALTQLLTDDNGTVWMVSPKGNGLICLNTNGTIDNTGDDRWRKLGTGAGNGNLPSAEIISLAKDKNGFVWVGTADGIGVIQCPELVFAAGGCDAIWPVVPNGNFAGYLFRGQAVKAIAVDGADRKWVATANGVFLVGADGTKVIYRFTEDNSPLLSNDVRKIAIDGTTGEVFFATAKGICSFRSTATEAGPVNQDVLVFPNPVPPGYTGTIAIRGLTENAIVKITETDGRLVYQARALGGQATWDGRNYRGQKISTGVYLVLVSDDGKKERTAAKLFFIQR